MKFPGERYGAKNLKDGVESQRIKELEDENKMQDNVIGLHEWDREITQKEKNKLEQQVKNLEIDGLTGAHRREIFKSQFDKTFHLIRNKELEQREGFEAPKNASLICLDLDKFKLVNDTYGHPVGDEVLQRVAKKMKELLRVADTLARLGGDEFAVLLPNTSEGNAKIVAEKMRASIADDSWLKEHNVTVSLGVCSSEVSTAEDPETFMAHADGAAYVAKRAGGNRVEVYK